MRCLMRAIVPAHAGRISVTSIREKDAQFTARLPLSTTTPSESILAVASLDAMAVQPKLPLRTAMAVVL